MSLRWGNKERRVRVLLDTGCSVPLVSQRFAHKENLPRRRRSEPTPLRNCSGEEVRGSGEEVTESLTLQHRRSFSREIFEITPLEPEVDLFLPYWWVARHPPQGAWDSPEMRFSSAQCIKSCTRFEVDDFSLSLDESIVTNPEARVIGYVSAKDEGTTNPLDLVPEEFRGYLTIMGKEAAEALPEYRSYDCKIDLKMGKTAPSGPIYPLSEKELETLREWLKEMLQTGKIRRSTSATGSPILFVPKPHG